MHLVFLPFRLSFFGFNQTRPNIRDVYSYKALKIRKISLQFVYGGEFEN
jgi:hypothetical protein